MPLRFWKPNRPKSVRQDWHAELPPEKSQVYAYALEQAKPAHTIFSVTLDQALSHRRSGKHEMARELAGVSAGAVRAICRGAGMSSECCRSPCGQFRSASQCLPAESNVFRGLNCKTRCQNEFASFRRFIRRAQTLSS